MAAINNISHAWRINGASMAHQWQHVASIDAYSWQHVASIDAYSWQHVAGSMAACTTMAHKCTKIAQNAPQCSIMVGILLAA